MSDRLDALLGLDDGSGGADRSAAGRGDHLWGSEDASALREIDVDWIVPNTLQPRTRFVEADLDALSASIAEVGVLQPVLVRQIDDNRYELIAGERRWRAARVAGLSSIPALVRRADDLASLEQAIVENLHRADLNPLEEAAAYRQLIDEFDLTQDAVAKRVGKSRSAVANLLRLLQLPASVQRLLASAQLSAGHARALVTIGDPRRQELLAARIVRDGLSVREAEELARTAAGAVGGSDGDGRSGPRSGGVKAPALLEIEQALGERLGTTVTVSSGGGRGRLVVEFADADDLDRIYRLLGGS